MLETESDKNDLGLFLNIQPQEHDIRMEWCREMNHAVFTMAKRQELWCEAAHTATLLDNFSTGLCQKSTFYCVLGVNAKNAKHLKVFGKNVCCGRYK